jgi:hypothetical protein
MIVFPALMVGASLTIPVADSVPRFDVNPSCKASANGMIGVQQDLKVCLDDENSARDQLVKEWSQFAAEDKTRCTRVSTNGGSPTYTELLVCLQMARDAKKLPKEETSTSPDTSDTSPAPSRRRKKP